MRVLATNLFLVAAAFVLVLRRRTRTAICRGIASSGFGLVGRLRGLVSRLRSAVDASAVLRRLGGLPITDVCHV